MAGSLSPGLKSLGEFPPTPGLTYFFPAPAVALQPASHQTWAQQQPREALAQGQPPLRLGSQGPLRGPGGFGVH